MTSPAGWTAYDHHLGARVAAQEWEQGGPRLGRIDIRVGDDVFRPEAHIVWLFSDVMVEHLGIWRKETERFGHTFTIPAENLRWWNDVGRFAGIVVEVANWMAAGVVGNAVYEALKHARGALVRKRQARVDPYMVANAAEAETMARWVVCAEFHGDECTCADNGRGHQGPVGIFNPETEDFITSPEYEFLVTLESIKLQIIEPHRQPPDLAEERAWTVTLQEWNDGEVIPAWEYQVEGILGPTFFTSVTRRRPRRS